jgi:hypothetical protein
VFAPYRRLPTDPFAATRNGVVGLAASLLLTACRVDRDATAHGAPPAPPPAPQSATPPDATVPAANPGPSLPAFASCPPGATLKEQPAQQGRERFCERDGQRHGRYTRFHDNDQLAEEVEYVDGRQQGLYVARNPAGGLQETGPFKDGHRTGHWQTYNEGVLAFEGDFENDVQMGAFTAWHGNGQKQGEGSFRKGEPCGVFKCWELDGAPAACAPLDGKCMLTKVGAMCPSCTAE